MNRIIFQFLHYHSQDEAYEKWTRRCQRINYKRLLVKFNDQNGCTPEHLITFLNLPYKNKLFFTCKKCFIENSAILRLKQPKIYESITTSHEPFGKRITSIINQLREDDFIV